MRIRRMWLFLPSVLVACTGFRAQQKAEVAAEEDLLLTLEELELPEGPAQRGDRAPRLEPQDPVTDLETEVTQTIREDIAKLTDRLLLEELADRVHVRGRVSSIDPETEELTVVDPSGMPVSVQVHQGTRLLGKDQIQLGDQVRTTYTLDENGRDAKAIEVLQSPPPLE